MLSNDTSARCKPAAAAFTFIEILTAATISVTLAFGIYFIMVQFHYQYRMHARLKLLSLLRQEMDLRLNSPYEKALDTRELMITGKPVDMSSPLPPFLSFDNKPVTMSVTVSHLSGGAEPLIVLPVFYRDESKEYLQVLKKKMKEYAIISLSAEVSIYSWVTKTATLEEGLTFLKLKSGWGGVLEKK